MQKKKTIVIGVPSPNLGYTLQKNPIWRWFYYDDLIISYNIPGLSHINLLISHMSHKIPPYEDDLISNSGSLGPCFPSRFPPPLCPGRYGGIPWLPSWPWVACYRWPVGSRHSAWLRSASSLWRASDGCCSFTAGEDISIPSRGSPWRPGESTKQKR